MRYQEIRRRYGKFQDFLRAMEKTDGGIENFALGHKTFGPQVFLDECLTRSRTAVSGPDLPN